MLGDTCGIFGRSDVLRKTCIVAVLLKAPVTQHGKAGVRFIISCSLCKQLRHSGVLTE